MTLDEIKQRVAACEASLDTEPFCEVLRDVCNGRYYHVFLTQRLRRKCRKGRVWKTPAFYTALKNKQKES